MPEQDHDYVDFVQYDGTEDKMVDVCRVYLTKGKLFYEGKLAQEVKDLVESYKVLEPFRRMGGYALLAMLPQVFCGAYFYCTQVKEAFDGAEA